MVKDKMKVFCSECKFSSQGNCWHKNNMIETPISRSAVGKARGEINRNNDCSWYQNKSFLDKAGVFIFAIYMGTMGLFIACAFTRFKN